MSFYRVAPEATCDTRQSVTTIYHLVNVCTCVCVSRIVEQKTGDMLYIAAVGKASRERDGGPDWMNHRERIRGRFSRDG